MKYLKTYNEKNDVKIRSNDGKTLDLSNLDLIELPELLEGLETLDCENNELKELSELPKSLKILCCNDNNFKSYNSINEYRKIYKRLQRKLKLERVKQ